MAPDGGNYENLLLKNEIMGLIDDRIKHIFHKVGSSSHEEIIECMIEDEDEQLLVESRNILFNKAMSRYACLVQGQARGMPPIQHSFELKERRGEFKIKRLAKDVLDLYLYCLNLTTEFPREMVKNSGTYFDVRPAHTSSGLDGANAEHRQQSNDGSEHVTDPPDDQNKTCSQAELLRYAELLQVALERNEHLERTVENLRAYILSVERVLRDEIGSVKFIAERARDEA